MRFEKEHAMRNVSVFPEVYLICRKAKGRKKNK